MADYWKLLHYEKAGRDDGRGAVRAGGPEPEAEAERERRLFPDLDTTLGQVTGPAAPPNRFRRVHRIEQEGRLWYLKEFEHTQWKNRLRSRLTAPRCALDAEREQRIGAALRARGFATARPVAVGRRGGASYYLCAAIGGASLRDRLAAGRLPRELALRAARFAGAILAAGIVLPDLSPEHVFVESGTGQLRVIDLHNGTLRRRPTRRQMVRVLRRCARSVRGLPLSRRLALASAVRLLRQAGRPALERRAILRRVPPFDTHGRYEVTGRSASYRLRNPRRTARELDLLRRVWPGREGDLVLDSPAGAGRLAVVLTHELGARRIAADRARAMLLEGRGPGRGDDAALLLLQADAMQLPCRDRSVDGVVVFRLLHHLDERAAQRVLAEAGRVAERFVVVSFFHPVSAHRLSRRLREIVAGRARTRHALSLRTLRTWMAGHGFVEAAHAADAAFRRDFWLAAFVRVEHGAASPPP